MADRRASPPNSTLLRLVEDPYAERDVRILRRVPTPPLERPAPRVIDRADWQLLDCWSWVPREGADLYTRTREAYVAALDDAFVEGCSRCHWEGAIYDRSRFFFLNRPLSPGVSPPRPAAASAAIEGGRVLVLVARLASDYYHFLHDTLPRLLVALPVVEADPAIRILVHAKPWVRDYLNLLGVGDRLLPYRPKDNPLYHAETLFFVHYWPSWDGACPMLLPHLRARLAPPDPAAPGADAVLYLDRDDSHPHTHNKVRRVVDQPALIEALRAACAPFELTVFQGSRFNARETIALFSRARMIIGPHGGAFANLAFTPPGARVIEFVPIDVEYAPTWHACAALGLEYWAVPCAGTTWASDFRIDADRIAGLVRHLLEPLTPSRSGFRSSYSRFQTGSS